jgi:hypothetical protein
MAFTIKKNNFSAVMQTQYAKLERLFLLYSEILANFSKRHDIQYNETQHNDTQQNDIQLNTKKIRHLA